MARQSSGSLRDRHCKSQYPGWHPDRRAQWVARTARLGPASHQPRQPGGGRLLPPTRLPSDGRPGAPPATSRDTPAVAAYYGPGACGAIGAGAIGNGSFVWPTVARYLSGNDYNPPLHPAIDIAGAEGNPIYATDGGVVVYSGWSNAGYGNLLVIDHGTGWQSAYAHLATVSVGCGQNA